MIKAAHNKSSNQRDEVLKSECCDCFYCLSIFKPNELIEWVDQDENGTGQTALCPNCGIDSVLGSNSGYPVNDISFLKEMKSYWFA